MVEQQADTKQGATSLATIIFAIIAISAFFGAALSLLYPSFINILYGSGFVSGGALYDVTYVILTLAADVLYLFGGGVITFGAILVIVRFVQFKLKDPYVPTSSTRYLSGYLTLGLNFFIGAEIIRTVATSSIPEFELLILVIFSRGLFSLILYLERRWHGAAETE